MATESAGPDAPRKKATINSVLLPVAIALAGVLVVLSLVREHGRGHTDGPSAAGGYSRRVGEVLPDISFQTLDGKKVLLSELGPKVTVINFWATWCGPCVKEMPSLQEISTEYASRGLSVVGVNVDEDPETVLEPFLKKHGITFRTFVDPKGELSDRFSVSGLPLTIIVDGNRKILLEQLGDEEWSSSPYRKQIELWLSGTNSG